MIKAGLAKNLIKILINLKIVDPNQASPLANTSKEVFIHSHLGDGHLISITL